MELPVEYKIELLRMARSGAEKPRIASNNIDEKKLGVRLYNYTSISNTSYDRGFSDEIRKIRPDWFIKKSDVKKRMFIEMAANGDKKPNCRSDNDVERRLAFTFISYAYKSSPLYDKEFAGRIRQIRPDWLGPEIGPPKLSMKTKKMLILGLARNKKDKPKRNSEDILSRKLCLCLLDCINKNNKSYDPDFEHEIRTLRPDWFRNK